MSKIEPSLMLGMTKASVIQRERRRPKNLFLLSLSLDLLPTSREGVSEKV